ncbi:MAG: carbohydrate-binding family 9-like protein [Planctomycetota bacterium]
MMSLNSLRSTSQWLVYIPVLIAIHCLSSLSCFSQEESEESDFPPVPMESIRKLDAIRCIDKIVVDGRIDEKSWEQIPWSVPFVDLISGKPTIHDTTVKVAWDNQHLYLAYLIEEPFVRAKFTERDSPIYQDNDVEFFIAGEDGYYEFEINAHGTIYEGLFVWQSNYASSGISKIPELDKTLDSTRSQRFNGVGYKNHPRGLRWAFLDWDFPGLQSAVHIDGTLNNDEDRDRGWTVELALPWQSLQVLNMSKPRSLPPNAGDIWRMDFSRFNQYKEAPQAEAEKSTDSGGWALSYHGVWDSHIPECFPIVTFRDRPLP